MPEKSPNSSDKYLVTGIPHDRSWPIAEGARPLRIFRTFCGSRPPIRRPLLSRSNSRHRTAWALWIGFGHPALAHWREPELEGDAHHDLGLAIGDRYVRCLIRGLVPWDAEFYRE